MPLVQRYYAKLIYDMCSNIYDQTFLIFHFLCGFIILLIQNKSNKVRLKKKKNTNNAYKEMQDA